MRIGGRNVEWLKQRYARRVGNTFRCPTRRPERTIEDSLFDHRISVAQFSFSLSRHRLAHYSVPHSTRCMLSKGMTNWGKRCVSSVKGFARHDRPNRYRTHRNRQFWLKECFVDGWIDQREVLVFVAYLFEFAVEIFCFRFHIIGHRQGLQNNGNLNVHRQISFAVGRNQFTWFRLCRAMVLIGISAIMPCFSGSHIAGPMKSVMIISQQRQRISRKESSPDLERIMNICEIRKDKEVGKKFIAFLKLSTNAQVNV